MPVTVEERKEIEIQLRTDLEAEFEIKLARRAEEIEKQNNQVIAAAIEDWRKDQEKLKLQPDELNKLLTQEYAQFNVKVLTSDGEMREFTLIELPQSIEKKFYRMIKDRVKPRIKELASLVGEIEEGKVAGRVEVILDLFEPALDILVAATTIVLNPFGKLQDITEEWVGENLSSARMWNIITAQEELNKLRSFFSRVSRVSRERAM